MNVALEQIPERILNLAMGALTQANTHAVYLDPGNEHWQHICVLNAAHAGELFIKAIIAKEHPLLIFKDIFNLDDNRGGLLDIETLIQRVAPMTLSGCLRYCRRLPTSAFPIRRVSSDCGWLATPSSIFAYRKNKTSSSFPWNSSTRSSTRL